MFAPVFDDCNVCSGGTSDHEEDADKDCAGVCSGEAQLDSCGACAGGTSGYALGTVLLDEEGDLISVDCSGVCFGNDLSCLCAEGFDCTSVCGG